MTKPLYIVIPVHGLEEAETFYPDTAQIIGPYLESMARSDYGLFYDRVMDFLPVAGDLEDVWVDSDRNIVNQDIFYDQLESALCCVRQSMRKDLIPQLGYEVISSSKFDNCSVIIKLVPNGEI